MPSLPTVGAGPSASAQSYAKKVLATNPIRYWPLWDTAGAAATELVVGDNGTYVGPTLGGGVAPDGSPCPLFDGINDLVDIWSAALAAAFNGAAGTVAIWAQVFNAGTWADAAFRHSMAVAADGNNESRMLKTNAANTPEYRYVAAGVIETVNQASASLIWMHHAITWSGPLLANEMRGYYNGVQAGLTQVALGGWVGVPAATWCNIGARRSAPWVAGWHGYLSHAIIYDRALAPAEVLSLATV